MVSILAERGSWYEAALAMSPVLSHQLLSPLAQDFFGILKAQITRPWNTLSSAQTGDIEQEFQQFQWNYNRERSFDEPMDRCDRHISFENSWKLAQNRFFKLREFCSGFTTSFSASRQFGVTSRLSSERKIMAW